MSSLEILKKIAEICDSEGFTYYLAYGTLIGAVRHKGFIPWDDDLDIMMPRKDYDKFIRYFRNNADKLYPFKLFDYDINKDYPYGLSRISDVRFRMVPENEKECGMGTFVDIYVLDGLGNDYKTAYSYQKKTAALASLVFLSTRKSFARDNTKGNLKMLFKFFVFIYAKIMGKDYFLKKLKKYENKFDFDNSEYIANNQWASVAKIVIYKRKIFESVSEMSFENLKFKVPTNYHEVLNASYGDYMKLPPEKLNIFTRFISDSKG